MNNFFKWGAAAVLAFAPNASAAETVLILGEAGPNRGARAAATKWFAEQVTERSGGDLKVEIQWGGALFKANAAVQSIGDGVADLGTVIGVYYPQELVSYGIADLPLDNPDAWVGMRATHDLMTNSSQMQSALADLNLVYLGTYTTSQVNIGCKDAAIRTADDVAGLKVRGVGAYGKVFGDMGADMVRMSIYDAYQGLDTGLIDCSQGYSYAVSALKQGEVMTSYTLLNWGQVGGVGNVMNKDMFDSLSDEHQAILLETGSDMVDYFGRLLTTANAKAIDAMREQGIEIIEMADTERAKLLERGEGYLSDWVQRASSQGLDGEGLLTEYRALIAKYTAERDENGYPWAE
ncbi:C4-dicarboxylate TRAP transporter substrate-binding protein [Cognatishimia sp.]|uniref:C4-dicarboxylate TRAP transporter substrate-binding protein n=1 Tax=Cognatishimia sp. TaxID=2211648 RepID=UPI0035159CD3